MRPICNRRGTACEYLLLITRFFRLWVIDTDGTFCFALEEVVDIPNEQFQFPLSRHLATPDGHVKLGHPSLLGDARAARLGGELTHDEDFGPHGWVLSNKSGRYGLLRGVEPAHLDAVVDLLVGFDIRVDSNFIQARL